MKYVQGISSRGVLKNDVRCALVMSHAAREAREYLRVSAGNLHYATFEYDMIPKTVPMVERRWPGDAMPEDTRCAPSYWPDFYNQWKTPVVVGRSHAHVAAIKGGRVTHGVSALRAAAQARARELLATRCDARRAEWLALQSAISTSQA